MLVSEFDYKLPPELVAQRPLPERDASLMLVMDRRTGKRRVRPFADLPELLEPGDCLVLNDTRVVPARLFGKREGSGGKVEVMLLHRESRSAWQAMLRPGRRMRPGTRIEISGTASLCTVIERQAAGVFLVEFDTDDVDAMLETVGAMPLPPYIRRAADSSDAARYQTVYAHKPGAVAAPTAGLHFTAKTLERIRRRGVTTVEVTLHVGAGTFRPVKCERVEDHCMHAEDFVLAPNSADAINAARTRGGRVVCVGTTTVRVLESCADRTTGEVKAAAGSTRVFLHPPYVPIAADGLLTNFHLPRSTLLMLVCTFTRGEYVLTAYREAVARRMRFYSYGDCMLLL